MAKHQTRSTGGHPLMAFRPAILALSKSIFAVGASATPIHIMEKLHDGNEEEGGTELWVLYLASMFLVLLGGAFAGLTIALMGQDSIYLQVIAKDDNDAQQKNAKRVFQLLEKGKHWVLVTLLLSNVIVNETLPVVLDRCLGGGVAAVIGSTVLIVIFGEVIPQSACVRYGLAIGGYMSKPVLVLMWILAPIAWPTAKLLDWALGEDHGTVYKKSGLKTLVTLHHTLGDVRERLNEDEVTIIAAVLDLKAKPLNDVMTPMDDVFVMSEDTVLDEDTIDMILNAGYSRIPIHEAGNPTNFLGMLLVKILITYDPEDGRKVGDFALATLPETRPETSCLDIINFFQEGKSHMVLVSEFPGSDHGALGVVTLEDVIEELIGEEIIDESDVYVDVHKAIRRIPHPPARYPRRSSHGGRPATAGDDGKSSEDTKIGEEDHSGNDVQRPALDPSMSTEHGRSRFRSASPMTSTLLKRRSSAGVDGRLENVPVRANYDDIKQHLKHLGPSNRASNPKVTRSTKVKIKPGVVVHEDPRSHSVAAEVIPEVPRHEEVEAEGDETTSLLRSAIAPKDGVHALAKSYGATGASTFSRSLDERPMPEAAQVKTILKDQVTQTPAHASTADVPATTSTEPELRTKNSTSSNSEIDAVENNPYAHRKGIFARSGSITEQVVETRGIRKTVLGTTSSNEDEDEPQHQSKSSSRVSHPSSVLPLLEGGDDDEEESGEPSAPSRAQGEGDSPSVETGNGGNNDTSGGKKKRRKKRKGSKN